jgi:putative Holliday junction resolvase
MGEAGLSRDELRWMDREAPAEKRCPRDLGTLISVFASIRVPMNHSPAPSDEMPTHGRLLGIDFGSARIGLAICDADQKIAGPLATYRRRTSELDAKYFRELIEEEKIAGVVMGMPLHLSGRESQKSREVERFARWLREMTGCPLAYCDERFSTAIADELIGGELTRQQRRERIDKIAAQVILASYLESDRHSSWQREID